MYIIGDVHGCFLTLKKLIEKIGEDNVIYSVGDLVDKGPSTCDVLDYVMSLPNFKMVLGNHEIKYIDGMKKVLAGIDVKYTLWYNNYGGKSSLDSYDHLSEKERIEKIQKHVDFLEKQKFYYYLKKEKIFITHGFALPYFEKRFNISDKKVQTQFACNRLEGRYFDIYDPKNMKILDAKDVTNVFGHDAHKDVVMKNKYMDIDTGCVYGGKLTAYDVKKNTLISIDCIDNVNKDKWFSLLDFK